VSGVQYKPPVSSPLEESADPNHVVVNIGPSHPATHGTIQIIAEIDGETVKRADIHCGYLHRGFEKEPSTTPTTTSFRMSTG
jgi:NADH-quinone oxidoreductase subunit D